MFELPYPKRQNFLLSQGLLFNKQPRYMAFFRMSFQLEMHRKTTSLPAQKKHITEFLHNRLNAINYKKAVFSLAVRYSVRVFYSVFEFFIHDLLSVKISDI